MPGNPKFSSGMAEIFPFNEAIPIRNCRVLNFLIIAGRLLDSTAHINPNNELKTTATQQYHIDAGNRDSEVITMNYINHSGLRFVEYNR